MTDAILPSEAKFWDLAEPLLGRADVTRSTMMGLPCLRWNGAFFASSDRRTGDLLVKLAESRVDQLVAAGSELSDSNRKRVPSPYPAGHSNAHLLRRFAADLRDGPEALDLSEVTLPGLTS